jgi:peptidoglycan DL-endopeptidase CwlO
MGRNPTLSAINGASQSEEQREDGELLQCQAIESIFGMFKNLVLCLPLCVFAQMVEPPAVKTSFGKPALITTADLADFDSFPKDRRKLIEAAIAVARDSPWLPYTARGTEPSDGGFDCSGAMYFVMRSAHLDPPRTSTAQYDWVNRNGRLHKVPPDATDLKHPSLKNLRPADLLFWGRPATSDSGVAMTITHVAMYLGEEAKDHRPVMINSTDGRSYRGIKANGYGVYDFRMPIEGAKIAFLGYGTPPGIAPMPE